MDAEDYVREVETAPPAGMDAENWDGMVEPPPGSIVSVYTPERKTETIYMRFIGGGHGWKGKWITCYVDSDQRNPRYTWSRLLHSIRYTRDSIPGTVVKCLRWGGPTIPENFDPDSGGVQHKFVPVDRNIKGHRNTCGTCGKPSQYVLHNLDHTE